MKYAIFSDIHGNLEAYQAVLGALRKEGELKYFCVGDIVGYGADPAACIKATKRLNPVIVCGNHDWAAVGLTSMEYFNDYAKKAALWTASVLGKEDKDYLSSLKLTYTDEEMTLVHGTLMRPGRFEYVFDFDTAYRMMELMATKIAFIGHSHVPGIFFMEGDNVEYNSGPKVKYSKDSQNKKCLVNVGSVGQPRDGDWRASYCVWDKDAGTLEIKRVEYDVAKARKKILDAGLPEILAERLRKGR